VRARHGWGTGWSILVRNKGKSSKMNESLENVGSEVPEKTAGGGQGEKCNKTKEKRKLAEKGGMAN